MGSTTLIYNANTNNLSIVMELSATRSMHEYAACPSAISALWKARGISSAGIPSACWMVDRRWPPFQCRLGGWWNAARASSSRAVGKARRASSSVHPTDLYATSNRQVKAVQSLPAASNSLMGDNHLDRPAAPSCATGAAAPFAVSNALREMAAIGHAAASSADEMAANDRVVSPAETSAAGNHPVSSNDELRGGCQEEVEMVHHLPPSLFGVWLRGTSCPTRRLRCCFSLAHGILKWDSGSRGCLESLLIILPIVGGRDR
ncbi:unnamed protein product [Lampetra planeri]